MRFYQILKMIMAKKGYNYPIKKKIPLILLLNLFGITIIAKFLRLVNIFSKILSKYLLGGRKEPPLCKGRWLAKQDGGIVKSKILQKNNPSVTFGDRADCQASATPKNTSKGECHPKHFLGLKLIDKTMFCKVSLSKE